MRHLLLAFLFLSLAVSPARADAIDHIVQTERIRISVRAATPPFAFFDDKGVPRGLAVQLCQRVVASLERQLGIDDLTIEYVKVDSLTRFDVLENREVDMHCGPMTITLARREIVDFSIPYFIDGIGAALRRGGVQQVADLKGQPVGALAGTTSAALAESLREAMGSQLIEFASYEAGLRALGDGMIDVYFGDQGVLRFQLDALKQENRLIPIKVSDEQFTYEPYGIAIPAGERRLRLEIDRALSQAYRSQEIFAEIERAFGAFEVTDLTTIIYGITALPE